MRIHGSTIERIKARGENTLVQIELKGLRRYVTVTREAIETHLDLSIERARAMTAEERCEFVRSRMPFVLAAVRRKIQRSAADRHIIIRAGEL